MSARDKLINGLWQGAYLDAEGAELADAYRAEVLAEAKIETVAWLVKKAREGAPVDELASKVDRGAVRAFLGSGHYRDAMDAYRAEVLREAVAVADRLSLEIEQAVKTREVGPLSALQELADELLRMAGEKATASAATATPQPDPGFLTVGRLYTTGDGFTAPELTTLFRVEHVTRHPVRGHLRALGWARNGAPGETWHGSFVDEDQADEWTEVPIRRRSSRAPRSAPAEVPAPVTGWHAARELTGRLARLLTAISDQRGEWTTNRVLRLYRTTREDVARSAVREDLHALHGLGWLVQHDETGRRFYTLNTRKDDGR